MENWKTEKDFIEMRSNRALEMQFESNTLEEFWWSAMVMLPRFYETVPAVLIPYAAINKYASQNLAHFWRNPEIARMHRQACVLLSATQFHLPRFEEKSNLTEIHLTDLGKSAFSLCYFVHFSNKRFLLEYIRMLICVILSCPYLWFSLPVKNFPFQTLES